MRFEGQNVKALCPGEPFDGVISFDTVHNLPDPDGFSCTGHRRPGLTT